MKLKLFSLLFLLLLIPMGSAALVDDLLAYYDFEQTGSTLEDKYQGIYNGTGIAGLVKSSGGLLGNSWNFTGTGWVNISSASWYAANNFNFTYSAWVNTTGQVGGTAGVVAEGQKDAADANPYIRLMIDTTVNGLNASTEQTGLTGGEIANNDALGTGVFNHLVMVGNTTDIILYVNNTLIGNAPISGAGLFNASSLGVQVRNGAPGSFFQGAMDEVGIWNRSLTASEVTSLWNGGLGKNPISAQISVDLNTPTDGSSGVDSTVNFNATVTPLLSNITNATLQVWNSTGDFFFNQTNIVTGELANSTLYENVAIEADEYTWNVYACGTNSSLDAICGLSTNFTYTRSSFSVNTQEFSADSYDTDSQIFKINISTASTADLFSASLVYNGTSYLGEILDRGGGNYTLQREIDIPLVAAELNHSFNWTLIFDLGSGFTSETTEIQNITISPTDLVNQEGAMNFSLFDEDTLSEQTGIFKGTFTWYLGNGSVTKNKSFDLTSAHDFLFNTTPVWDIMTISSDIFISNETSNITFADRLFNFNKDLVYNSTFGTRDLLFANKTRTRSVIVEVKDVGLSPLENIYVDVQRFYPDTGLFKTTDFRRTDSFGQFAGRFIENDVRYRFDFYNENNTLLKTEDILTISCRTAICILPFVVEDAQDEFDRFENATGFEPLLTYNNNTTTFAYTWNDVSGGFSSSRLEITQFLLNGTTVVYNQTSAANPGTLSYNVGTTRASYVATAYRTASGKETKVSSIRVKVGDLTDTFGLEGLMWSFILLMTMLAFGIWSPPLGVVLYVVGYFLLGILDIVYIHPGIIIAQVVLGVLFIWAFKN